MTDKPELLPCPVAWRVTVKTKMSTVTSFHENHQSARDACPHEIGGFIQPLYTRATPYPVTKEEAVELKQQIEKMASVTMSANPINNSELSLKVTLGQFAKLRRLLEAAAQQQE